MYCSNILLNDSRDICPITIPVHWHCIAPIISTDDCSSSSFSTTPTTVATFNLYKFFPDYSDNFLSLCNNHLNLCNVFPNYFDKVLSFFNIFLNIPNILLIQLLILKYLPPQPFQFWSSPKLEINSRGNVHLFSDWRSSQLMTQG